MGFLRATRIGQAILLGIAVITGGSAIRGWDIWWHLKTGELAFDRLSSLPVDEFSLTQYGQPWVYKDLGADLLFYLLHRVGGETGLALFKVVISVACLALVMALSRHRTRETWVALLVSGFAFLIAQFRLIVRPEGFSLVMFPLFLVLIEKVRRGSARAGRSPRTLACLVVVQWLWANLHRGALLGLVLLWGYAFLEWISWGQKHLIRGARSDRIGNMMPRVPGASLPMASTFCAVAATAASALNPSGVRFFTQGFRVATSDVLARAVSEWQALGTSELVREFPLAAAWIAMVLLVLVLLLGFRRFGSIGLWDVALAAVFIPWGLKAPRMLPFMAIATVPLMAASMDALGGAAAARVSAKLRISPVLASILVLGLGLATAQIGCPEPGWAENRYPREAVQLILQEPIEGEGYTTFTFAGYLIFHAWPAKHVLCDGRFDTVYSEQTISMCLAAQDDPRLFSQLRERYDLQWVLSHNRPGPTRQPASPRAFDFLDVDPDWALVHWDSVSLLYVWRHGPNARLALESGYRYLRPHDPDVSLFQALEASRGDPARQGELEVEVARLIQAAPDDYRAAIVQALFLHSTRRPQDRELALAVGRLARMRQRDPEAIDRVIQWLHRSMPCRYCP